MTGPAKRNGHGHPATRQRLSGSQAVDLARRHLRELTGNECESISSIQRGREGWSVQLETVELERIPRTTDILASYLIELDERGQLMSYERVGRYYRNQATPAE